MSQENSHIKTNRKAKCGRLFKKFSDQAFCLYDESYFTLIHFTFNDNSDYYSLDAFMTQIRIII